MEQFQNDELGYREWIWQIRHGFVLVYRAGNPEPNNLILHSAKCWMIAAPGADGTESTARAGKACSVVRAELEALAEQWGGVAQPHHCLLT